MHNLFKKYALGVGLALGVALPALGANVPLLPSNATLAEPNQIIGTINALIQSLNTSLPGQIVSIPASQNPSATTAQTIFATNVIMGVGQAVRVKVWGVNGGSASTNTITLNYGSGPTAAAIAVTGTSAKWWVECLLTNGGIPASPVVNMTCYGVQGTTAIASTQSQDTTDNATVAQALNVTTTATVASQQTILGAWAEYVR